MKLPPRRFMYLAIVGNSYNQFLKIRICCIYVSRAGTLRYRRSVGFVECVGDRGPGAFRLPLLRTGQQMVFTGIKPRPCI